MKTSTIKNTHSHKSINLPAIFAALALLLYMATAQATFAQTTATFNNSAAITIPLSGAASPYPSNIAVSGFVAGQTVTKVTATLTNINHPFVADLDVLLVSPSGRNVILMSDAGRNSVANLTLKFDDAAASELPVSNFGSGTYRPTNIVATSPDTFPAPAPAAPYGTALSVFNGESPNGTWKLYVVDDDPTDGGNIAGGYSLTITTTAPPMPMNYVVTRVDDRNNVTCAAGDCSLREAVKAANANPSADTISFNIPAASCNASTNSCTITLTTASGGEIAINSAGGALTINGTGANLLTIDGGAGTNRIFLVNDATATIQGVTLSGGDVSSGRGAAISASGGTLILEAVVVRNNTGSNNSFTEAAVYFFEGTNHRISNSTFSANTGFDDCAAFYSIRATLTVVNTTISGNSTIASGGGTGAICIGSGSTTFRNTTISGNTAGGTGSIGGGGIFIEGNATVNLGNTIVASNTSPNRGPDLYRGNSTAAFTTAGYNLIGDNSGVEATFPAGNPNANNDIVGTSAAPVNPMLGALQNNGGTTPTHALLTGSPAIDKGFSFGTTTDQRGLTRPIDFATYANAAGGNGADIGAVELQIAPTAASVTIGGRAMTANGRGIRNVRITLIDSSGNTRTATTTAFGYYRFDDAAAGETYILTASGKRFTFRQPSQILNVTGDVDDINFIGDSVLW